MISVIAPAANTTAPLTASTTCSIFGWWAHVAYEAPEKHPSPPPAQASIAAPLTANPPPTVVSTELVRTCSGPSFTAGVLTMGVSSDATRTPRWEAPHPTQSKAPSTHERTIGE